MVYFPTKRKNKGAYCRISSKKLDFNNKSCSLWLNISTPGTVRQTEQLVSIKKEKFQWKTQIKNFLQRIKNIYPCTPLKVEIPYSLNKTEGKFGTEGWVFQRKASTLLINKLDIKLSNTVFV